MKLLYPVKYIYISQGFNGKTHFGIDMGWKNGVCGGKNQPVYAPADGEVIKVVNNYKTRDSSGTSYGNYILIKHDNNTKTRVAHLKYKSCLVKKGDKVKRGDKIATMGDTGHATGYHTHYEVIKKGKCVDPIIYTYYTDEYIIANVTKKEYKLKKLNVVNNKLEIKIEKSGWYKIYLNEGETLIVK